MSGVALQQLEATDGAAAAAAAAAALAAGTPQVHSDG
jgi:hypothetical protein